MVRKGKKEVANVFLFIIFFNKNYIMSFINNDVLYGLGIGYSIGALALVVPLCFIFRQYVRFLDHLQIFYLLYVGLNTQQIMFSGYLGNSWVSFNANFYTFCTTGDFICTAGFPLSFGSCLAVALILFYVLLLIERRKRAQLKYQSVYLFFKGLIRWIYLPLTYYSLYFLILSIQGKKNDLAPSIVILSLCFLFPIIQLIAYKCIQTESDNPWRKWIQFISYYRLFLIGVLVGIGKGISSQMPYYFIYGIYTLYIVFYLWKNTYVFPMAGRILFFIGEIFPICVSFFFLFNTSLITTLNLDFFFISAMLLIDVGELIAIFYRFAKWGLPEENDGKIIPDNSQASEPDRKKQTIELQEFKNDKRQDTLQYITLTSKREEKTKGTYRRKYKF